MFNVFLLFGVVTVYSSMPINVTHLCSPSASRSTSFAAKAPKITFYDHFPFTSLLKSHVIASQKMYKTNRLLSFLIMIVLSQANDIHLNPGPSVNHENGIRIYLCGTCDEPVTWDHKGIICETCDQWYHSECQSIHSKTYDLLSDSKLNVSWHCITCSSPNYSTTVHDIFSNEVSHCLSSSSLGSVPDISTNSPEPTRHKLKPVHSSTPSRVKT